jgi:hypothetical protein
VGAHSTMVITARDARMLLLERISQASDKELESQLDAAFYDRLFNFRIVEEYPDDSEATWSFRKDGGQLLP